MTIRQLEIGTLDLGAGVLQDASGTEIPLTFLELQFLRYLAEREGDVVPTAALLQAVWGYAPSVDSRAPGKLAYRLRKKIELDPSHPRHLLRVPNQGFSLVLLPRADTSPTPVKRRHLGPFFGRDAILEGLRSRALGGGLFTLTGLGGVGKTALANRFVDRFGADFPGGVFFVDLLGCRSEAPLLAAVAQALTQHEAGGVSMAPDPHEIADALAGLGHALLVLDNLEDAVEAAREVLPAWRHRAPDLALLVTSRIPLLLGEEHLIRVAGLKPEAGRALFLASVRKNQPDYDLIEGDEDRLQDLVDRLDGVPLAIEMAAGRAHVLPMADLVHHLDQRFELLRSRRSDRPSRQRSLRAILDYAWERLDGDARDALLAASLFGGSFDRAAAEGVFPPSEVWIIDRLSVLLERNLLVRQADGQGLPRFRVLESVRDFAADKLDGAARDAILTRLGAHYARWISEQTPATGWTTEQYRQLSVEVRNLRVATHSPRTADALTIAFAILDWLQLHGPLSEGRALIQRLLERADLSAMDRSELWAYDSALSRVGGQLAEAAISSRRAVDALADSAPSSTRAAVETVAANLQIKLQNWEEARVLLERAIASARAVEDPLKEGIALGSLGFLEQALGAYDAAERCYLDSLQSFERAGSRQSQGAALCQLTSLAVTRGHPDQAQAYAERALPIHAEVSDRRFEAITRRYLGRVLRMLDRPDAARAELEASLTLHRAMGSLEGQASVLVDLAGLEPDGADAHLTEALRLATRTGHRDTLAQVQLAQAQLDHRRGRLAEATRRLNAAEEHLRASQQRYRLGVVLVWRGRVELALGRIAQARALQAEVHALVEALGIGPRSELGEASRALSASFEGRSGA